MKAFLARFHRSSGSRIATPERNAHDVFAGLPFELHVLIIAHLEPRDIDAALGASRILRLIWLSDEMWPALADRWFPGLAQQIRLTGLDEPAMSELFRRSLHRMCMRTAGKFAAAMHYGFGLASDEFFQLSKNVPVSEGGVHSYESVENLDIDDAQRFSRFMMYSNGRVAWWPEGYGMPCTSFLAIRGNMSSRVAPQFGHQESGFLRNKACTLETVSCSLTLFSLLLSRAFFFVITLALDESGKLTVYEVQDGEIAATYVMKDRIYSDPKTSERGLLRWEKLNSFGGYCLVQVIQEPHTTNDDAQDENEACPCGRKSRQLISLCFNIYTKSFTTLRHHLSELSPWISHVWNDRLFIMDDQFNRRQTTSNRRPVMSLAPCTEVDTPQEKAALAPMYTTMHENTPLIYRRRRVPFDIGDMGENLNIELGLDVLQEFSPRPTWNDSYIPCPSEINPGKLVGDDEFFLYKFIMSTAKPFDPFYSERLVYRAVNDTPEDEAFVHAIQRDAEAQSGASYGLLRPESIKNSKDFQEHITKCLLGVIICLPPTSEKDVAGEPIGILCLKANPPSWAPHRWTDVSIDVLRKHQGKGYGGEAIRWSLWWAFQMAGLHRVQIQAFSFNTGAMRLYERLGFKEEGRIRDHMWFSGSWHDGLIYGILEDEWRDGQTKAGRDLTSCA
ncbi:hypothetical protein GQX73_g7344 [Xylaria multiplex]|uniref:N-acetyltransferase domain-containing protein n=1 Tax=Xylaria multiplex TaxID=323545 RepID=A0A7C8MMQ9_9PEZI|nr:hypothetical protein GQX73_g7344 [Xylaria multiplex]